MKTAWLSVALNAILVSAAWAQGSGGAGALRELVATVLAVAAVCVIAFVCLYALKRLQGANPTQLGAADDLRFVRALPVGARERLVVVRWRGRTLLLGVTAGAITILDGDAAPDVPAQVTLPPAELTRTLLARIFARRPRENPS